MIFDILVLCLGKYLQTLILNREMKKLKTQVCHTLFARVNPALSPRAISREAAVAHMIAAGWCLFEVRGGGAVLRVFARTTIDESTGIYPAPSQDQKREVEDLLSQASENWPKTARLGSCRRQAQDKGGRLGNAIMAIGRAIAETGSVTPLDDGDVETTWPVNLNKTWAFVNARTVNAVELAAEVWQLVCEEVFPQKDADGTTIGNRVGREAYGNEVAAAVGKFRNAAAEAVSHDWEIIPPPVVAETV